MRIRSLLARLKRWVYRNPQPALNDLDRKLQRYLDFRDGFFVEAGANDGYTQSNTFFLERKRGWRGLLVEGIPELCAKCRKLRTGAIVHHCALVAPNFAQPTVRMHFASLMSVVEGAFATDEERDQHLRSGVAVQGLDGTYSVDVPARTLESILDEIPGLPAIDFFSLDVEGYELEVLKGLNLDRYRPRFILVEGMHYEEVNAFLLTHGYELAEKLTPGDFLYRTGKPSVA